MKNKFLLIPGAMLAFAVSASAAVPAEVSSILDDLEATNTLVVTTAAIVLVTWLAIRFVRKVK